MKPFNEQIKELAELKTGWYEPSSAPVNKECILAANALWSFIENWANEHKVNMPIPAVIPTCSGNVQLEWIRKNREFEISISWKNNELSYNYIATTVNGLEDETKASFEHFKELIPRLGWLMKD